MSYEGYDQFLCEEGHYWTKDVWISDPVQELCPTCGKLPVWWNPVDLTNGSFDVDEEGKEVQIDNFVKLEQDRYEETICQHCGHAKVVINTFKIPEDKGHRI